MKIILLLLFYMPINLYGEGQELKFNANNR